MRKEKDNLKSDEQIEDNYLAIVEKKAIEDKVWKELNTFDIGILKSCIDFNNFDHVKKYYKEKLGVEKYPNLFRSLKNLEDKKLLRVVYNHLKKDRISDIKVINGLSRKVMEDSLKDSQEQETSIFDDLDRKKFKEELKFKLTINDISNSPNKPTFGGTIEFNEQRLLNPGKEYTFGMWERSKSEFYLTIVPTEVIVNSPKQQTLSRKPKIAQDAINEYFDTVNFENSKK